MNFSSSIAAGIFFMLILSSCGVKEVPKTPEENNLVPLERKFDTPPLLEKLLQDYKDTKKSLLEESNGNFCKNFQRLNNLLIKIHEEKSRLIKKRAYQESYEFEQRDKIEFEKLQIDAKNKKCFD